MTSEKLTTYMCNSNNKCYLLPFWMTDMRLYLKWIQNIEAAAYLGYYVALYIVILEKVFRFGYK